jgi:HemY protein
MADIEEVEGHFGAVREWLARAAPAPRDKAWVADGVISDRWAPVSPSGALDAFVWRTPDERIAAPAEPARTEREATAAPVEIAGPPPEPTAPPGPQTMDAQGAEPQRRPSPLHAAGQPPRASVIIDPATMAPDDPGAEPPESDPRGFRQYASE